MFRWLGLTGLIFLVSAAQAVDSRFELLLDLDNDPASGCTVATSEGPFVGADAIVATFVETSGLVDALVASVERRDCTDPGTNTFGPPQVISPGDWPVGVGNGEAGFNVIETFVPVTPGQWYQDVRVGLIASDEFGNVSALLSTTPGGGPIVISGLPTIPVPLVSPIVLALLALVFLAIGIAVISRRGRLTLTALAFLGLGGAAAAACVLDGEIFDWTLEDLLATGTATDPNNGVDLRALFGKLDIQSSQLCFRIDAALVFSDAPQAEADGYVAVETNVLAVPAGSGLLINDNLGIPDADLVSFGGGDLGGTPGDHAPGSTIPVGADGSLTVNVDGSFSFQSETGFEGDFEFFYRLENIAGQSDGLVTIEVQSVPVAQDDSYAVVDTATLSVPAPGVLGNDNGLPAPQVISFGGGDLGGGPGDNAAGSSVVVGGDGSLTLNADGSLTFDPPSGQAGPFVFDYMIGNPAGSATATITITVNQAPSITSADVFVCSVGSVCTFAFTADGFPDPTITLAGALPSGVTFNALTEALEGTPDAGSGAEYVLTVTAANGIGTNAEQIFTLTVNESPTITSADTLGCQVETDCDFTVTADGYPAATFSLPGLPAGLSLDAASGVLSGQPGAGTGGQYNLVLEATNSEGTDTQAFTLDIGQAPVITSADNLTCEVGQPCSLTLTATGFPAPTFDLPGLPAGLTLDPISGQLSGTPDPGTGNLYNLTAEASNSVGTDTQAFALTINQAPVITSAASLVCEVGQPCDFTLTATGYPAPTFDLPGLPSGLTLDPVSGLLSGTSDAGTGGEYNLTVTAQNGIGTDATQPFVLTINQQPAITSPGSLICEVGQSCTFTATATGFPAPTFDLPGLPAALSLDPASGQLSGIPDPGTGGEYALTLTATNGIGIDATQAFALTVNEAPTITSGDMLGCETGQPCTFTFTASGFPASTFDLPGLPAGLSLDPAGSLTGIPDPGTGGVYNLTLGATNGIVPDATQAFTLTIGQPPVITSADNLVCEVGQLCTFTLTATGFPAPTFALPGLPSGLALDPVSGQLSGSPDPGTGGLYNLTAEASNSAGIDTQAFALTINQAPVITSANSLDCLINQPCSFTVTATGYPAPTFGLPGLPTGLTIDAVTGLISGTPTQGGVFNLILGADNGVAPADSQAFTLQVGAPPQITSANATTCQVGVACNFAFTATGTPAPAITLTGTLPAGVTFDGGTNSLSGTPLAGSGGTYNLTVEASNGFLPNDSQAFVLTVNEAPVAVDDPNGGIPAGSSPGSVPYHGAFNANLVVSAAAGVLANDTPGFPAAAITTPSPVAGNGSVSLAADGSLVYSPNPGFSGLDSFQYCIENLVANSCATVTVAIGERPSAADGSYPVTLLGNVAVNTALASGYSVLSLAGGDGIVVGLDSTINGNAVVNGNGTFVFDPAAGFAGGNAGLVYSVSNGFGTVTGTVTLAVGPDRVWFANNALAAAGDGRLSSPFNTLAALDGAATGADDVLFLYAGSGAYTGGLVLLDNQVLVGEAASAALAAIAGLSVPADSVLPTTGGTAPVIVNAGGNGLTLAFNNRIQGFAIGNTSGVGISGTNFGTLTAADVSIAGTGQALSLNTGSVAGTGFSSVSSSSGGHNILLTTIGGTLNLGNGSLSGATTSGFEVSGGTATISYGGTITTTGTARPVRVLNRTAGTLTLSGAITGANGILLTNNTGSTMAFAGTLNLNTGTNPAFEATGGGTITASGAASVLQATTAPALRVVDTTIGAAGVTLQRVSSNGGNSTGMVLDNTGAVGGLRVTGTGTPGSGGTIANKTGADGLLDQGIGILLADTADVELNWMQLNDFTNFAILGSNVNGFALVDSVISGSNGSNDVIDEAAVLLTNLLGSGQITRTSISGGVEDNVRVINDSGILDRLVVADSTFSNAARPLSNDGLRVAATGTAFVAVTVANSSFSANRGDHFDGDANGSSTLDLIFTGNTMTGGHPGAVGQSFVLSNSQSADVVFDVSANTIRDSVVNAMTFFQSATSTVASSMRGAITGNAIGVTGVSGSGSAQGSGLVVNATGLGEVTVSVLNNQIRQWSNPFGLLLQAGDPGSVLNATATGNSIQEPNLASFPLNGMQANIGTTAAGAVNACLDIRNNTLAGSGAFGADDFRIRQRNASTVNLPGYVGAVSDTAAVVSFVQAVNVGVPTGSAAYSAAGGGFTGAGAGCPQP